MKRWKFLKMWPNRSPMILKTYPNRFQVWGTSLVVFELISQSPYEAIWTGYPWWSYKTGSSGKMTTFRKRLILYFLVCNRPNNTNITSYCALPAYFCQNQQSLITHWNTLVDDSPAFRGLYLIGKPFMARNVEGKKNNTRRKWNPITRLFLVKNENWIGLEKWNWNWNKSGLCQNQYYMYFAESCGFF